MSKGMDRKIEARRKPQQTKEEKRAEERTKTGELGR
jgi:hypothetical protein